MILLALLTGGGEGEEAETVDGGGGDDHKEATGASKHQENCWTGGGGVRTSTDQFQCRGREEEGPMPEIRLQWLKGNGHASLGGECSDVSSSMKHLIHLQLPGPL